MGHTKLGYQLLGAQEVRGIVGPIKGIKIVGGENDLAHLKDWEGVEIREARLITAEDSVREARDRNILSEIPDIAKSLAETYAGVAKRLGTSDIWWEIPPIMPAVTPWTAAWFETTVVEFDKLGLKTVPFGFATGTPKVFPYDVDDEWPMLYGVLKAMHKIGPDRTAVGVEEYITGGQYNALDHSNVGRIQYVITHHTRPLGLNIRFRGIEGGWDLPPMWDAGVTANNLFERGLDDMDAFYQTIPEFDVCLLYAIMNPVGSNEAAFAFTPGKPATKTNDAEPGYLENIAAYLNTNPPVTYAFPYNPTTPPPVPPDEPPPTPPPTVSENLLANPDFSGGEYAVEGDPDKQHVPEGWEVVSDGMVDHVHAELELDPFNVVPGYSRAGRVYESYEDGIVGYGQIVPTHPGDKVTFTVLAKGWCVSDPQPHTESDGSGTIKALLHAGGKLKPGSPGTVSVFSRVMDKFVELTVQVVATGTQVAAMICIDPDFAMSRTDLFVQKGSLTIEAGSPPPPTPTPDDGRRVVAAGGGYLRNTPVYMAGKENVVGELKAGTTVYVEGPETTSGSYKYVKLVGQPSMYIATSVAVRPG